jgi:hypothetical protein
MRWLATVLALGVGIGCGGKVVVDEPTGVGGAGGAGGAGASTPASTSVSAVSGTTTTTTSVSVASGPGHCSDHADCPYQVCIFATGQCAPSCVANACDPCETGSFCDSCATSSCPACEDCRPGCVPLAEGRCDDNDGCPDGQACFFAAGYCAKRCNDAGACGDFEYCDACATGSCCGCDNCVPICLGGE